MHAYHRNHMCGGSYFIYNHKKVKWIRVHLIINITIIPGKSALAHYSESIFNIHCSYMKCISELKLGWVNPHNIIQVTCVTFLWVTWVIGSIERNHVNAVYIFNSNSWFRRRLKVFVNINCYFNLMNIIQCCLF